MRSGMLPFQEAARLLCGDEVERVRIEVAGRGPGLVNEDAPRRVKVRLRLEPVAALLQDIRTVLFDRVTGLFFRVIPCRRKKRYRADVDVAMPRPASRTRNSSSV